MPKKLKQKPGADASEAYGYPLARVQISAVALSFPHLKLVLEIRFMDGALSAEQIAETRKIIFQEIRECRKIHGKEWWDVYFGNFGMELPFGSTRLGNMSFRMGYGEVEFREFVNTKYDQPNCSDKKRGMTFAEFYIDIDATIDEAGLSSNRLFGLQCDIVNGSETARREMLGYVFPVYVMLRAKGYNHYPDITA